MNAVVDAFDEQNAAERDRVEEPLNRCDRLFEHEDRDRSCEDRREILYRLRRRKRHLLEREEKAEKSDRTENPAEQQREVVITDEARLRPFEADHADRRRDDAAKKDRLHRRDMRDLLDEIVRQKEECRR